MSPPPSSLKYRRAQSKSAAEGSAARCSATCAAAEPPVSANNWDRRLVVGEHPLVVAVVLVGVENEVAVLDGLDADAERGRLPVDERPHLEAHHGTGHLQV